MRRTAGIVLGVLLAVGCGGGGDGGDGDDEGAGATTTAADEATTTTAPAPEVQLPDGAPVVELLDAGAEPRRPLRFDPEVGDEQRLTIRQEQTQVVEAAGVEQTVESVTEMDLTYVVEDVTGGIIRTRVRYDDARVVEADAASRPVLEDILDQFTGAEARTEFDARGYILDAELPDLDLGGIPGADQLLDGLESQLATTAVPFPDDPVGAGARWRVTTTTELAGILAVESTFTVTLDAIDDDEVRASMTASMTFADAGGGVEVESGELRGGGSTTWPLGGVIALSDQTISGTVVFAAGGQRVTQHQEQRIALTPR